MGKIFSCGKGNEVNKYADGRVKVCIYGGDRMLTERGLGLCSPQQIMLRYLKKMEVEPKHVEIARRFLADGAKEYNNDKSLYAFKDETLPSNLDPEARHGGNHPDFAYALASTGGRHQIRPIMRIQDTYSDAKIFYVDAKIPSGAEYYYKSIPYTQTRIKEALYDYSPYEKGYLSNGDKKLINWEKGYKEAPVLFLVDNLGKEGAKTPSEIELAYGLNEARFPYRLQAVDVLNNGQGINEGLQWLKERFNSKS